MLAAPGSIGAHSRFACAVHVFSKAEGGYSEPVTAASEWRVDFGVFKVHGKLYFSDGVHELMPGEGRFGARIELTSPCALEAGTRFLLHSSRKAVAAGVVTMPFD